MSRNKSVKNALVTDQISVTEETFGKGKFYSRVSERLYRALDYLSIYVFIIMVYGGALLTDYFLFGLIALLLSDDVQSYPLVALWFDYARIGLALLFIVSAIIHGIISTVGQVKLDIMFARESES